MRGFVLVHGAFRGGWAWDRVARRLRDAGHVVATPDVVAADALAARAAVTLDDLIHPIVVAVNRVSADTDAPSTEPVRLRSEAAATLPTRYLFFTATPDFMPCTVTRERLDAEGVSHDRIDAGHDGIVTAPDAVAEWLVRSS